MDIISLTEAKVFFFFVKKKKKTVFDSIYYFRYYTMRLHCSVHVIKLYAYICIRTRSYIKNNFPAVDARPLTPAIKIHVGYINKENGMTECNEK